MYLGVDYYPEQWGLDLLDEDLQGIKELGCNIIRVGDFAWDVFEPEEGRYDFELFDKVVEKAQEYDLKVMMCVPSATMPRWLNLKYPQIMAEDEKGNRQPYGGRRGYCYNSDIYLKKAIALTKAMAEHYKENKTIVIWQLDNEIGHEGSDMCYCENCQKKFHDFLQEKYESIDDLNRRWGTSFWTQTYQSFQDIQLPKTAYTAQNPTLRLEWERFRSKSIEHFLLAMYQALKSVDPNAIVLHDLEGGTLEKHFDPFKVARQLDDIAYNNYPVWGGLKEPMKPWEVALSLDVARGFRQDNFWITEEIMGAQGHDIIGCAPKPNQGSCWAMQALAHGCKSFMIFRYRGFNRGAEQLCFGIIDADNQKRRKYFEVQNLYRFIRQNEELFQSKINNHVAMIFDYDSAAAFRIQRQSDQFNYVEEMNKLYKQLWLRNIPVDIITKEEKLDKYQTVIIPYMIVMDSSFQAKLKKAVKNGVNVVLTARSSWKDTDNNFVFNKVLPQGIDDLVGAEMIEQESLLAQTYRLVEYKNNTYEATIFADYMRVTTAKSLVTYKDCCFGDYSAVTINEFGQGKCYYIGSSLQEELLEKVFDLITNTYVKKNLSIETIIRQCGKENFKIEIDYENLTYHIEKINEQKGA